MSMISRMSSRLLGMTAAAALLGASAALAASGDLVINAPTAPSTLDPAWACGVPDIGFLQNFYVRLVDFGIKKNAAGSEEVDYGSVRPYLAKSWTISDDGKTYTFKLNDNYKFTSGKPVDAAAVKYSFERGLKMGGCGQYFLTDGFLSPSIIESIEAPDATTVVIKLTHSNANSLADWATGAASIVDPSVIEANGGVVAGKPNEYMSSHVAGSGPFTLDSYTPNQSAHATANPNFGGEPPLAKSIQMNWISSAPTLLLQARSGQADITYGLSKQAVSTLKSSPNVKVEAFSNPFVQQMMLPNTKAPWDNVKVREAVAYAVPYEDIVKKVAFGYGTLYYGPVPPSMAGFNAELSKPITYDPAKAKQLLAESGVKLPVDVEVLVQEGDSTQQQIATILQSTWSKLGINLNIRIAPGAEYQDLTQAHKVQSLMRLDGPGVFEAGYYFGYDVMCKTAYNLTESCNPKIDELVVKLRATLDKAEHQNILDEITKLWRADYPKLLFFEDQPVIVLSKNVKTFRFAPLTDFRFMGK